MTLLIISAIAFVATYIGVEAFRRWCVRAGFLDVPNERSSHHQPTPRGGGVLIVAVSLLFYLLITGLVTNDFNFSYLIGAVLIASVSWLDDRFSLSFLVRLIIHSLAALILIWGNGPLREIYLPIHGAAISLGSIGPVITFLWIVWLINAFNFMDGIDGIAASQAVLAGFGWMVFAYLFGLGTIYYFAGVIAFSSLGFLVHNWSPAKIFMGDVGSAFLGFTFAAIPLLASKSGSPEAASYAFMAAVGFLWLFVFDSVLTLTRRSFAGQRVWLAHRQHLYQRLVIAGKPHQFVTFLYSAITLVIIALLLLSIKFRGTWELLLLFITILLSAGLTKYALGKKGLT